MTLLALAGAAALVIGPATSASADVPASATLRIDGRFDLLDDDWDYDETEYEYFSRPFVIAKGTSQTIIIKSRVCAGGEVRGELRLLASYYASGTLIVMADYPNGIRMYEGSSCSSTDLDGIEPIYGPGPLAFNKTVHQHATVHNNDEGGDDRVEVSFDATRVS